MRLRYLIVIYGVLIVRSSAWAQESFTMTGENEIKRRASNSTSVKFTDVPPIQIPPNAPDEVKEMLKRNSLNSGVLALRFYNPKDNLIPGAGTDDSLPDCRGGNIRQDEILNDSQELDLVDLLFYSYEDKEQMARAQSWELPTAPYLPGDIYNPFSLKDPQQLLARWVNLVCLPTRVRRVYNNEGVAFLEYREGTKAWEKN